MERWHSSVMMKSKVSMGIFGLYVTSRGLSKEGAISKTDCSSISESISSSPLSMEKSLWMVVMHTLLTVSMVFEVKCCTL